MIFRRLSVALLSLMASEGADTTDTTIASYVLAHRGEVAAMSVRDLAVACHVGTGTVSRFCRHAGLAGFDDLRRAAAEPADRLEPVGPGDAAGAWAGRVPPAVAQAARTADKAAVGKLAQEMRRRERIAAFGLLKAQAAAICLQADLLMYGRVVRTHTSYADQLAHVLAHDTDEVVVVFSCTGGYFEGVRLDREQERFLARRNLWMVAPRGCPVPGFLSGLVAFESDGDQLAHPFHLQAVASLIAQEYTATSA